MHDLTDRDHANRFVLINLLVSMIAAPAGLLHTAYGQHSSPASNVQRLAVFLDCARCDQTFIRQEMRFVDYVRDREQADVHVLITVEETGGGGDAYRMDLIGRGAFQGIDYDATYTSAASDTYDEERRGLLRTLEVALVPYLMRTPLIARMSLTVDETDDRQLEPSDDPWKGWTIEFYADGSGEMESSQYSFDARYGVFVDRVTEEWKIRLRPYFNYNFDRFERGDETITSESRRDGFDSYLIKSINEHWSAGLFGDLFSSTFQNIALRTRVRPGIEYSLFPYWQANRRQLTVAYLIGGSHVAYNDTTIFGETEQLLGEQALRALYEVTQTWGMIDIGVEASQYLHDLTRYNVQFGGDIRVRLTRGLSIDFGGTVELVHDQLYLPKGDATLEEVLLRQRQLATNFEMGFSVGFRYRIGSIYNNVVNTRF